MTNETNPRTFDHEILKLTNITLGVAYTSCETELESKLAELLDSFEQVISPSTHPEYPKWELLLQAHQALFAYIQTHTFNLQVFNGLYELSAWLNYELTSAREMGNPNKASVILAGMTSPQPVNL